MLYSPLYVVIVVSTLYERWKYIFAVWSCGVSGVHYKVVMFLSAVSSWVNGTEPHFFGFNEAQSFLFNMDYSSSND